MCGPLLSLPLLAVVLLSRVSHAAADDACTGTAGRGGLELPPNKFLYFGYGSNLLAARIHVQNPSAVRYGIGKLRDYRLDFNLPLSERWGGAPATVVPHTGEEVWGALWTMNTSDRDHLDDQEGVREGLYDVFQVPIELPAGELVCARAYALRRQPDKERELPMGRQPSRVYKQVILHGARESGLPEGYIKKLETIPDNGSAGSNPPVSLDSLLVVV